MGHKMHRALSSRSPLYFRPQKSHTTHFLPCPPTSLALRPNINLLTSIKRTGSLPSLSHRLAHGFILVISQLDDLEVRLDTFRRERLCEHSIATFKGPRDEDLHDGVVVLLRDVGEGGVVEERVICALAAERGVGCQEDVFACAVVEEFLVGEEGADLGVVGVLVFSILAVMGLATIQCRKAGCRTNLDLIHCRDNLGISKK